MGIGVEVLNTSGQYVVSATNAGFRYRGKFSTTVPNVTGYSGDEFCAITLTNVASPLVFIGGNTLKVYQKYQNQAVGSSTCLMHFGCVSGQTASFTGYVFDLPSTTGTPGISVINRNGNPVSVTTDWSASSVSPVNLGLQAFDASGALTFDAFMSQLKIVDVFTNDNTMAGNHTYGHSAAAIDLAIGHYAIKDPTYDLYQINRQAFKWSGNTLICERSNPGSQGSLDPPGADTFRAPIVGVINTTGL